MLVLFHVNSQSEFRQKHHTNKTNALLFGKSQKLAVEESFLMKQPDTRTNKLLLKAVRKLGLREYERYKHNLMRTADYTTESVKDSVSGEVTGMTVKSTRYPEAPPRFVGVGKRCDCKERIAELDMCVHEVCVTDSRKTFSFPDTYDETVLLDH